MDAGKLSEVIQPPDRTAVPVQYSIQQPDHRKQGFETDTDRTDGTGCSPLADQYRIHGDHVHDPYLYHSIHGRICACKEEICGTTVTFHIDRMRNGITKTGYFIPLLREMSSLNLYNTIWAVIFPIVGWPFGVFLMKQFSEGVPSEMLEAAQIDGASEAKTFLQIVVPMIKPGIGALAIFTFINSWNDYFMQLIMLSSTSNLTISLGIAKLQAENATDFGLIMAGAALAALPIIIVFLLFQKYFTKGITMGAVKG